MIAGSNEIRFAATGIIDLTRPSSATATGSACGSQVKYRNHQNGTSSSGGG
jgi:hypothetical protein